MIVLIVISAVLVVLVLFVAKKNNLCCFKYKQVPVKEGAAGMLTKCSCIEYLFHSDILEYTRIDAGLIKKIQSPSL